MQIPSIRDFAASRANYFFESSWKGKTVQVLGALSIFALLYYVFLKKAPPQGPGASAKPLSGRVDNTSATSSSKDPTQPAKSSNSTVNSILTSSSGAQPKPKELPKVFDRSYIKNTQIDPDIKSLKSAFDTWLSLQVENFPQWRAWAGSGDKSQEALCRDALGRCTPELKNHVKKMIPVFENRRVKRPDADAFLKECNEAVIDKDTNLVVFCTKLKRYLSCLETWNDELNKRNENLWMSELRNFKCPHYEFTNLLTQYFDYLGLRTKEDLSQLLQTNLDYLEQFGIREMEDVNCLQLTNMQPLIERLRQLVCLQLVTKDQDTVRPPINKEIKQCREVLKISEEISRGFCNNYSQELQETVKKFHELFDELTRDFDRGMGLLKQIEENDIVRQRILLKGYINQGFIRAKWEQLNKEGVVSLASCAKVYKIDTLAQFYNMNAIKRGI